MPHNILTSILFFLIVTAGVSQNEKRFQKIEDLSNEYISSIAQDDYGFIWAGTNNGLFRYDGYKFDALRRSIENKNSLSANGINQIEILSNNSYWIATQGGGLNVFNPKKKEIKKVVNRNNKMFPLIFRIQKVSSNLLAMVTDEGIYTFNKKTQNLKKIDKGATVSLMAVDGDFLWFTNRKVLYKYSIATDEIQFTQTFDDTIKMISIVHGNLVLSFNNKLLFYNGNEFYNEVATEDEIYYSIEKDNLVYFASSHNLYTINSKKSQIAKITSNIPTHTARINTLFIDHQNNLWIGTSKGIYKESLKLPLFKKPSIPFIARTIEKHDQFIYLGGRKGLYKSDNRLKTQTILDDHILALRKFGNWLWAANVQGDLFKIKNDSVYKNISLKESTNYTNFRIYDLEQDNLNRIWVGTWSSGISIVDENLKVIQRIKLPTGSDIGESKILKMLIDTKDRLWIATATYGVFMLPNVSLQDLNKQPLPFKHYTYTSTDIHSLNSNIVFSLTQDNEENIWIATENGMAKYNEKDKNFIRLRNEKQLFDKKIMAVRCDFKNNIWMSTINDGIYVYNQLAKRLTHYKTGDGLASDSYLFTSAYYDREIGTLYFGGYEGVQSIDVKEHPIYKEKPKPIITDILINGKHKDYLSNFKAPFEDKITLSYLQNDFSLRFSNFDYSHISNVNYAYKLGSDKWKTTEKQTAYFSNISYGNHVLKVKPVYNAYLDESDFTNALQINIQIPPPWYRTTLAYILYALLIVSGIILVLYLFVKSKVAELKTQKTKEINELQSKMYANISHEFRTPITIIKGLSKNIGKSRLEESIDYKVKNIEKNSDQLLHLVNQMLDLVSLDAKKMEVYYKNGDIINFLKKSISLYKPLAESKQIHLKFNSQHPSIKMDFDDDKLQKALNNILSNALKFTPENGAINVTVFQQNNTLKIVISDTGKGIKPEDLPHIFNRYYKTFDLDENLGSGIGMSLTKELVLLMDGCIDVASELNKGTQFSIQLPIKNLVKTQETLNYTLPFIEDRNNSENDDDDNDPYIITEKVKHSILIVEDNSQIRNYVKELLGEFYIIYTAKNGKEGIKLAENKEIDFIISDIMMPEMDGFEFCKHIKENLKTSHIPFVIISARTQVEDKIKGYKLGIDAYLFKPFNEEELLLIIKNLFDKQQHKIEYFSELLQLKESDKKDIDINKLDIDFIKEIQEYALNKEQRLTIDQLAKKLSTSRSQLHRKIKSLTGQSITNYINFVRIEKAKEILATTSLHVSEIAYETGFESPTYFSKAFKKVVGVSPTSFRENHIKN